MFYPTDTVLLFPITNAVNRLTDFSKPLVCHAHVICRIAFNGIGSQQCCYNESYCDSCEQALVLLNMAIRSPWLTHWGRVTHTCIGVSIFTITGSDNGLSPGRRQVIIWTSDGILLIEHVGTNFSEILIEIITFSFKKMHVKVSSGKWRPFCLGLNELTINFVWYLLTKWRYLICQSKSHNSYPVIGQL